MVGVGHSIGATLLLALAGGRMWMKEGECLPIPRDERIKKLALFTPPLGFFQAPGALGSVPIPIQAWAGTLDALTPPTQGEILKRGLPAEAPLKLHLIEGAGHFSFMNSLPPHVSDSMPNREAFLADLAKDICSFFKT